VSSRVALACLAAPLLLVISAAPAAARSERAPAVSSSARAGAAGSVLAVGPLTTALVDVGPFLGPDAALAFQRVRATGATAVRLVLFWKSVAPDGVRRPSGFNAADPEEPSYRWGWFDRQVSLAARYGLEPIVGIQLAPRWAEQGSRGDEGTRQPSAADLADFARAAALRYSGHYGWPRVRYWQAWNEPNASLFLTPQSPTLYRRMLNSFADAVHRVRQDNVVIGGGLSSFGFPGQAAPPLDFMRELLCMSGGARPRPVCREQAKFDIWAHHPYTSGGPTRHAVRPGDVSLGDLPEMRRLLEAAIRSKRVVSRHKVRFWVTEFSWDSSPPDPQGVPSQLHARWVSEALYRMWRSGVSLVTWFQLRDDPIATSQFQSGLYRNGASLQADRPKRALRAFRFPFVAFREGRTVFVWGRTPEAASDIVIVEARGRRGWRSVAAVPTRPSGLFQYRFRALAGPLRARLFNGREASLPFSLTRPPDRTGWPFGCGGVLPCN
jgi:hypothetical protein